MAIREGRWDCQYCGALGNMGRDKACPNCGSSRPEGTKFYLADDAEITDKKLLRQATIGPDWNCEFCGTSNAADITICGSCNAPREASSPVAQVKDYELGEAPTSGDMAPPPEARPATATEESKAKPKLSPMAIAGIAGAVLLLCICIVAAIFIFGGQDVDATVSGFTWERAFEVEAFQTVTEEDWSIPDGGRLLSQSEEIHHYDQILDHYETRQREVSEQIQVGERTYVCGQRDLGNGFFEDIECSEPVYETQNRTETYEEPIYREEPVYQTRYVYEIDKWVVVRTENARGDDHSPYWPRADLGDDEREGARTESYLVFFTNDKGDRYSYEVPLDEWQGFEAGQGVKLKLNALGEISEVEQ